jgi:hypothetical protein
VVEAFTGVWCIHCPTESEALFNLSRNTSPNELDIAELHVCAFAPGTGPCLDDYVPADNTSDERGSFYDVCGYPDVFFDGGLSICGASNSVSAVESEYSEAISNASRVPGNVSISQSATFVPGSVSDTAEVTSAVTGSFNVVTYLEEYIGKRNVSVGYGPHDIGWVVRETLGNQPASLVAGTTTGIRVTASLNASWDPANLSVLTFVQQNSTKIIENANFASVTNRSTTPFSVAFAETGLPAGTPWSIVLNGTRVGGTGPTLRSASVRPGTYNFTVSAPGYRANVNSTNRSAGVVTVGAINATISVAFSPQLFPLVFHEAGLPPGTGWGVLIGNASQTSFGPNVTYLEPNGSYGYVVLSPTWYVTSYPGPASVNGTSAVVQVIFRQETYPIVFVEFGLPASSNWSVTVSNQTTGFTATKSSVTNSITFFLVNGTYAIAFTLPPGFAGNASTSSLAVSGTGEDGPTIHAQGPTASPVPPTSKSGSHSSPSALEPVEWVALGAGVATGLAFVAVGLRRRGRGSSPPLE